MNTVHAVLEKLKYGIVLLLVFLVPFSLVPSFQNFIPVTTMYVFTFGATLLLIISFVQLLTTKKILLHTHALDVPVVVFLCGMFLSLLLTPTNKTQALLDPNIGFMVIAALSVFYFYGRQYAKNNLFPSLLSLAAFIISSFIIVLSLEPTRGIGVIPLDLVIFLGFAFIYGLGSLIRSFSSKENSSQVVQLCMFILVTIGLIITCVTVVKQQPLLPSFVLSFNALVETVKHPFTALFGVGTDNYSVIFTRIKDVGYNRTNLWQIPAPSVDRSALFYVAITTGMVGLLSFLYLLFSLIQKIKQNFIIMSAFVYLLFVLIIFPPSFLVFFLIFFLAGQSEDANKEYTAHLSKSFSWYSYMILIITACVLFGAAVRYLSSMSLADYFYAQSLAGMKENSFKKVYDNQQKALSYNPYLEQYHLGFARTHFVLSQNIIDKAASGSALVFTKESKQMLIEAIRTGVNENQLAIGLNPRKAEYWANLAQIYTIIPKELQSPNDTESNSPQTTAVTYYKKALELDPNNPAYYFQMSQLYLAQQNMDDGFTYAKKAVEKKSNWADAHYQLAIIYLQKKDTDNAVKELETTLQNLDPQTNQKEYDATKQLLDKIKAPQSGNPPPQNPPQPQDQAQPPAGQPPPRIKNLPPQ